MPDVPGSKIGDCLGVVDANSLVYNFIRGFDENESRIWSNSKELFSSDADKRSHLHEIGQEYGRRPVTAVMSEDFSVECVSAFHGSSLLHLLEHCLLANQGREFRAHRVFLAASSIEPVSSVLSQMDVARFLVMHPHLFANHEHLTIRQLGVLRGTVVSVHVEATALEAFRFLVVKGVSCVAVLSATGQIVTCLSASDFRGIGGGQFQYLLLPVPDFLRLVPPAPALPSFLSFTVGSLLGVAPVVPTTGSSEPNWPPLSSYLNSAQASVASAGKGAFLRDLMPPVVCTEEDTFGTILRAMVEACVHRVFVCDEKQHPVGVASLSDLLITLISSPAVESGC